MVKVNATFFFRSAALLSLVQMSLVFMAGVATAANVNNEDNVYRRVIRIYFKGLKVLDKFALN